MTVVWLDDALLSQYKVAFPLLKRYKPQEVIIAVPTSYIGKTFPWTDPYCQIPCMTKEQLKEMVVWGCGLASHSATHPCFKSVTPDELKFEIESSKLWIIQNFDIVPKWFVPPFDVDPYPKQKEVILRYYKKIRVYNPKVDIYIHELGTAPIEGPPPPNRIITDYESKIYNQWGDYYFQEERRILEAQLIKLWRAQRAASEK